MQTISIPYSCSRDGAALIADLRRIYSAAVRTAYAKGVDGDGKLLPEKDLRHLVKARYAGGALDAWGLHCATLEGREARKRVPDGKLVFGGRSHLLRSNDGLLDNVEWKVKRLLPFASRGDKTFKGNRHFRLSVDGKTCIFQMYGRKVQLRLAPMSGNQGEVLRQAAQMAADKQINLMCRIDATHIHVTVDPGDLPDHPERRRPLAAIFGRAVGVDLNPKYIGYAAVANIIHPEVLEETRLLDYTLAELDMPAGTSDMLVRETLAAIAGRIVGMARKHRAGTIVVEKGLGKLRSRGKNRSLNRQLNYWARTVFIHMLTRKARLAGIKVIEVWSGYSTTIGNLAFEAPDACASAAEIGRRGIARAAGFREVLPAMAPEVVHGRWKDQELPTEVRKSFGQALTWGDLHRRIKSTKIGYRRPHPALPDSDDRASLLGHAVHRLGHRHRTGRIYRSTPVAIVQAMKVLGFQGSDSTRKSE